MAQWQYDEPGITYDEVGRYYDSNGVIATIKLYYNGGMALTKQLLRRAIGF